LYGPGDDREFSIDGRPRDDLETLGAHFPIVSADYFAMLGVPLQSGRHFDERDALQANAVALVNETMAQRYWPEQSPIGQRIRRESTEPWTTIVGVVGDVRHGTLRYPVEPEAYIPFAQNPQPSLFLVVRAHRDASLIRPLKEAIWSVDPELPASNVRTMEQALDQEFWFHRTIATALGSFSIIALLLAAFGTFAVISYLAAQQTQEIGVRVTFGATRRDVFVLVFRQAAGPIAVGLALGTTMAIALSGALANLLYGVTPFDPPTLAGVLAVLIASAALAVYVPARRAAGMDPALALRQE
jgi:putative ABC transport system permease protein